MVMFLLLITERETKSLRSVANQIRKIPSYRVRRPDLSLRAVVWQRDDEQTKMIRSTLRLDRALLARQPKKSWICREYQIRNGGVPMRMGGSGHTGYHGKELHDRGTR